jgi:hypothetical protein
VGLLLRYWPHLLVIALAFASGAWVGVQTGNSRANKAELALSFAQRDAAQQAQAKEAEYRERERGWIVAHNKLEQAQQKALDDAKRREDDRVAGLLSGNLRLRHEIAALYTARLSGDSTATGEPSDAAERGAELIAAALGVGAACDARHAALIAAYEAVRTAP